MVADECHKDFFNYCFIKQMKKTFESVTYLKPENKTMKKYVSLEPGKKSFLVYLFKKIVFHLKTKSKFPYDRGVPKAVKSLSWPRSAILIKLQILQTLELKHLIKPWSLTP